MRCRAGFVLNCLPSPSPDIAGKGVLQGAEFVSRTEGQNTLKLLAFSTFFRIQDL